MHAHVHVRVSFFMYGNVVFVHYLHVDPNACNDDYYLQL